MNLGIFKKLLALCGYPQRHRAPIILAQSAIPASVTGTTSETVLATISIPAGAVGVNGSLRITTLWSNTNNANSKTIRYALNGTAITAASVTTSASLPHQCRVTNRGVANSQITSPSNPSSFAASSGSLVATAIDTSVAVSLTISGQLGVGTDTLTLEAYLVEALNP